MNSKSGDGGGVIQQVGNLAWYVGMKVLEGCQSIHEVGGGPVGVNGCASSGEGSAAGKDAAIDSGRDENAGTPQLLMLCFGVRNAPLRESASTAERNSLCAYHF